MGRIPGRKPEAAIARRIEKAESVEEIKARFMFYVAVSPSGGCWTWTGGYSGMAYGRFYMRRRGWAAHRAAYLLWRGELEPGQFILHQCDNKRCVNPAHLRAGTHEENMRDAIARKRMRPTNRVLSDEDVISIRAEYEGIDGQQHFLAAKYGVNHSTIANIVNGHSYQHLYKLQPPRQQKQLNMFDVVVSLGNRRRGEQHHKAKLTVEQVRQMRAESAAGVSGVELARRYGIRPAQVSDIIRRKSWKDA